MSFPVANLMPGANNFKDRGSKDKRSSPSPVGGILESTDPFEVTAFLVLGLVLLVYITNKISDFSQADKPFFEALRSYILRILPVSLLISAIFIMGIVYSIRQLTKLNKEWKLKFHSSKSQTPAFGFASESIVNKKWQKVLNYMESTNMGDWKLAILEADILLEEMIDSIGYRGESLGEKLKNIERGDFTTIDKAWEAHKIRNAIAHEGADFMITQREARRVVGLFEEVFKEFKYI